MIRSSQELDQLQNRYADAISRQRPRILVCTGTGCVSAGSLKVLHAIRDRVRERGDLVDVELVTEDPDRYGTGVIAPGCRGSCEQGPLVEIQPDGPLYVKVKVSDVPDIVKAAITGETVERLLYEKDGKRYHSPRDIPFYLHQKRITLVNCGLIDAESLPEYIAHGGYQGLAKVLAEMTPAQVIDEVKRSGLRGLGGGGFPTGRKWEACWQAPGEEKYVICNGDEGDPGAFMDRSIMEGDPHSVLEGMIIAGYAVGAERGIIYVRAEYPLAVKRLGIAITQARENGLLGKGILGSGFDFDIEVFQGAGAFVCGESTALVLSIEGKRGMPESLPRPRTTEKGLWDKPTLLNNVKTFANIGHIIFKGADWFAGIGTAKSKGTAIFALTGKVVNCGLIEVPMGITLRQIIYDIGGGIPTGKTFKAAQIGGPSGGCLSEEHLDYIVDFDSLTSAGAMMGSGGLVVLNEDDCMVEIAHFFMKFTQNESCGKCVPCREGTQQMLDLLARITEGNGQEEDLDILEELAITVKEASLCGLGQTASNPVLTTLRYFRDEYIAHIREQRCPAKVCPSLISYRIIADKCKACMICLRKCPIGAIIGAKKEVHVIDQDKCNRCGICLSVCPERFNAVECIPGRLNTCPVLDTGTEVYNERHHHY